MTEWIKTSDKMPELGEKVFAKVLAIYKSEKGKMYNMRHDGWFRDTVYACRVVGQDFFIESNGPKFYPTHWMYTPEIPNE